MPPLSQKTRVEWLLKGFGFRGSSFKDWYQQAIAITVVLIIIIAIFYDYVSDEPFYDGEVWGDLRSDGEVIGFHEFESRRFAISTWHPTNSTDGLLIEISNISSISMRYWEDGEQHRTNYPLVNRSLVVDASPSGHFSTNDLVDARISYLFREFSGYWVDEFDYRVHMEFESIDGWIQMPHDPDDDTDFYVDKNTLVTFDNFTLTNRYGYYEIPEGEVADIHIIGSGNCSFTVPPEVHIKGSLTVEDFEVSKKGQLIWKNYERVRIDGDDIIVKTKAKPRYDNFKGREYWDPWVIEIDVPEGAETETQSRLVFSSILVYLIVLIIVIILFFYFKGLYRRSVPPQAIPIEVRDPPRIRPR